jgi:thiosulfate reductase cytochrome b subunit
MAEKTYMYTRYERFWHWSQAALILFLIVTGFEVHGSLTVFGFEKAVTYHQNASYLFIVLSLFTIFWHFTTGEWRQYKPTRKFLVQYIHFYTRGIFSGAPHPTNKERLQKLNPLQRLTYFTLKVFIIPVQVLSGLVYLYYPELRSAETVTFGLSLTAWIHTLMAFFFIAFLIVHVYLTTTGATLTSYIKAMITGYEDVSEH